MDKPDKNNSSPAENYELDRAVNGPSLFYKFWIYWFNPVTRQWYRDDEVGPRYDLKDATATALRLNRLYAAEGVFTEYGLVYTDNPPDRVYPPELYWRTPGPSPALNPDYEFNTNTRPGLDTDE